MNKRGARLRDRYRHWLMQRRKQQPQHQCREQAPIALYHPGNQTVVTWIVNGQVR